MTITREDVLLVLDDYLTGTITREEAAKWAYDTIFQEQDFDDPVISITVYNLASYHDVGLLFAEYRPTHEKIM